jgi:hypothetical protein
MNVNDISSPSKTKFRDENASMSAGSGLVGVFHTVVKA